MDYAESLRIERTRAHAVFHTVIMELSNYSSLTTLLFFEGEDDPAFYFPHIRAQNNSREYISFICNGRGEVIKTLELIDEDGRAYSHSLFFIDKDHNDFIGLSKSNARLFQTTFYSIENYLVSSDIINSYWVEVLHLDTLDKRKIKFIDYFNLTYKSFNKRMLTLMALVLIGRGYASKPARKLNLNNANFDLIFNINFESGMCKYATGAGRQFAVATNVVDYSVIPKDYNKTTIKKIIINDLRSQECKKYIRGKYELWFFVRFLNFMTHKLSSKSESKLSGLKRATPKINFSKDAAVEYLAPRIACPKDLSSFLQNMLSAKPKEHSAPLELISK